MQENKTKDSQIKATREYDKRKGLVTIACKISQDFKKDIEIHIKSKGYKSINAYLIDLIKSDMNKTP